MEHCGARHAALQMWHSKMSQAYHFLGGSVFAPGSHYFAPQAESCRSPLSPFISRPAPMAPLSLQLRPRLAWTARPSARGARRLQRVCAASKPAQDGA